MKDLNYFPLDVESNIYSMTTLEFENRTNKVLVATVDCKIFCITYKRFKSHTREVEFTYIPNGAKINSIGSIRRGPNDYVIGITHSLTPSSQKNSSRAGFSFSSREGGNEFARTPTYYLNIYAGGSMSGDFDLDYVAQGCQTIRLRYVPYHLISTEHVSFIGESQKIDSKPLWLLSGGDKCIHSFCEDLPHQSFNETPIAEYFPELSKRLPSIALWIDVMTMQHGPTSFSRAVALGLENGSLKLFHSILTEQTKKFQLVRESSFDDYTTIIPSVRLFKTNSTSSQSSPNLRQKLKLKLRGSTKDNNTTKLDQLNVLALSSTNSSLVFQDVLNNGLDKRFELPESKRLDCSVASVIGDLNVDGLNEIIIGTYGRELLTYQYDLKKEEYFLAKTLELNYPVFALSIIDLTGDALNDLIILLASGIMVMQADVREVTEVCRSRVDALLALLN